VIAVPAYPPRNARNLPRIQSIVADAKAKVALTTEPVLGKTQSLLERKGLSLGLSYIAIDRLTEDRADEWRSPNADNDTLAFLQYTSGSTGSPKGVMVSHGNILANERMIKTAFQVTPADLGVGWLPLFHDMGLIGHVIQPIYAGVPSVLMSPAAFLQKPVRWLRAISEYGATISGGPNFAYELCMRKTTAEDREGLDLSHWRVAYSGAEPVRAATLQRFSQAFAGHGFRHTAHFPCYGLAEATLMVSGGPVGVDPETLCMDGERLEQHQVARAIPHAPNTRELVSCGRGAQEEELIIVDPETALPCPLNRVGEIWVRGTHVAQGYWNRPEQTEATFCARRADTDEGAYLRTGDLGFLHGASLVVTGRLKDVVVIHGRNVYPQDIEWTVQGCHADLQLGATAAFSVDVDDAEQLVVVQELKPRAKPDGSEVLGRIREAVGDTFELAVHDVVLVKAGTISKTSSGKIQRSDTRRRYLAGELEVTASLRGDSAGEATASTAEQVEIEAGIGPADGPSVEVIQHWMIAELAQELRISPSEVDIHQPFSYYGLASVEGVTLVAKLEAWLGRSVPLSLIWDYPTVHAASQWLESTAIGGKLRLREHREQEQRLPMPGRSATVSYQPISKPRHAQGLRNFTLPCERIPPPCSG
jgi:acyl-CoA synthetase (AMP-forming)/AMP-acid ligase II/acyl carrier protein